MFKKIAIAVAVLVAVFVVVVLTRPAEYAVERSTTVSAAPEVLYPMVADFHRWAEWSPWDKLDPAQKREFSGPSSGTGAAYHWLGNDKVGEGNMSVVSAKQDERVEIKLEFIKPFPSTSTTIFALKPAGSTTTVSWRMEGRNESFMAKAFSVFMNMDKMIGPDFENGLATMKSRAEAEAAKRAVKPTEAAAANPE